MHSESQVPVVLDKNALISINGVTYRVNEHLIAGGHYGPRPSHFTLLVLEDVSWTR